MRRYIRFGSVGPELRAALVVFVPCSTLDPVYFLWFACTNVV